MNLSFIKDLNLLKTSGIRDVIIIDIQPEKANVIFARRKEGFAKVKNGDIHNRVNILHKSCCLLDDEFQMVRGEIKNLIKNFSLKDPVIIAGISEFKHFNISVPSDTDDAELWMLENSGKFLPEGRPKDEFTYSYELYRKDDSFFYYNIVVVRSDYIRRLEAGLNIDEGRLFAIFPFPLALISCRFTFEKAALYIQISDNRIVYSAVSSEKQFSSGELYNEYIEQGIFNSSNLRNDICELKEMLLPILKEELSFNQNGNNLNILLNTDEAYFKLSESIVSSVFTNASLNEVFCLKDSSLTGALIGLNHIFNNAASSLNLLKEEEEKVRFSIEKQLTMRIVLFFGIMLISVLLTFFILETYISSKLQVTEDSQSEITTKTAQAEQLKKENRYIKTNLNLIRSLKTDRAKYTSLMYDITKVLTDNSCLTGINFKSSSDNSRVNCEITGTAKTQEEVAGIVEKMEKMKSFHNVSLLFSGYSDERQSGYEKENDENSKMIHFNISAMYNAD